MAGTVDIIVRVCHRLPDQGDKVDGPVGESPEEGNKDHQRAEALFL